MVPKIEDGNNFGVGIQVREQFNYSYYTMYVYHKMGNFGED